MRASAARARRCSTGSMAGSSISSGIRSRVRRSGQERHRGSGGRSGRCILSVVCRVLIAATSVPCSSRTINRDMSSASSASRSRAAIVEQSKWTQTALKAMPDGQLNWTELFGRDAPVVLDLGCGNGRYLIGFGARAPGPRPPRHRHPAGRHPLRPQARQPARPGEPQVRGPRRARAAGKARRRRTRSPRSTATTRSRTTTRRRFTCGSSRRRSVAVVHRALVPGGLFVVQTDNPGYWKYIREVVPVFFDFHERIGRWPDCAEGPHAARDHRAQEEAAGVPRPRHGEDRT